MSSTSYIVLDGEWPVLGQASPVPSSVLEMISSSMSGLSITNHIGYLSIGDFFIDSDLLEQHMTQRPIDSKYVDTLRDNFETTTILRSESPGVVIGLGEGWNWMKNTSSDACRITNTFPHLHHLSIASGGPIGQIIRGGHRTEAVRRLSKLPGYSDEKYWYYTVLLPSKFSTFFLLINFFLTFIFFIKSQTNYLQHF